MCQGLDGNDWGPTPRGEHGHFYCHRVFCFFIIIIITTVANIAPTASATATTIRLALAFAKCLIELTYAVCEVEVFDIHAVCLKDPVATIGSVPGQIRRCSQIDAAFRLQLLENLHALLRGNHITSENVDTSGLCQIRLESSEKLQIGLLILAGHLRPMEHPPHVGQRSFRDLGRLQRCNNVVFKRVLLLRTIHQGQHAILHCFDSHGPGHNAITDPEKNLLINILSFGQLRQEFLSRCIPAPLLLDVTNCLSHCACGCIEDADFVLST
mmetsp:Transcript_37271/g.69554  ORF Transcript_37271/g.69554 Transcript_37271/m.69554 type:complete len:269 (-) Transcript_37271:90-896(-)